MTGKSSKQTVRCIIATFHRDISGCREPGLQGRLLPVPKLPAGEKWTFEINLDGYRCISVKRAGEVTLFSRRQKVLNRRFPGVVDALASVKGDFVLDGELVVLDRQGRPSFQLLQGVAPAPYFYAFDILNRDSELLVDRPLLQRRAALESLLAGHLVKVDPGTAGW